jgi:hypothetical protein
LCRWGQSENQFIRRVFLLKTPVKLQKAFISPAMMLLLLAAKGAHCVVPLPIACCSN